MKESTAVTAPERTVERLCLYRRILLQMEEGNKKITSSYEIAESAGVLDSQVRKDLSFFGQLGICGKGYKVKDLKDKIGQIIGKNQVWRIAIVGVGNLGSALLGYPQFKKEGFEIVTAFDADTKKVGRVCSGIAVEDAAYLAKIVQRKRVDIGIIAVPAHVAQEVADNLVKAGIKAILNFATCRIGVPEKVKVLNVDFCLNLDTLTHFLMAEGIKGI